MTLLGGIDSSGSNSPMRADHYRDYVIFKYNVDIKKTLY